jgi:hypothetical protein
MLARRPGRRRHPAPGQVWGWKLVATAWTFRPENLVSLLGKRAGVSDHPAILADLVPEP